MYDNNRMLFIRAMGRFYMIVMIIYDSLWETDAETHVGFNLNLDKQRGDEQIPLAVLQWLWVLAHSCLDPWLRTEGTLVASVF